MKHLRFKLPSTLLFIFLFASLASAGTHEDVVAKYLALSGISDMLKAVPGDMEALASQTDLTSKHPDVDKRVYLKMKESFDVEQAEKSLSTYLLKNTDEEYLGEMLRWLESPLAIKVTSEETNSGGPGKRANVLRYLADLQSTPPAQDRIALIHGLEQAAHASELASNILIEILKGMIASVNLALPESKREAIGDRYEEIDQMKPILQEAIRREFILTSFYTYRNISDEELSAYMSFYESDLGQKEIRITGAAISDVLKHWFEEFGKKMIVPAAQEAEESKE